MVEKIIKDVGQVEKPSPFVKWAGGKRKLLDYLNALKPRTFGEYYEPFVGAGALLFDLTPPVATISDLNDELINIYKCIKSKKTYPVLLTILEQHEISHSEDHYYKTRGIDREADYRNRSRAERAARAIYLNKTCFNGLYRVNSNGFFNVPSAKKTSVKIYDLENLKRLHKYLNKKRVKIRCCDFERAVKKASEGDFVYFDPPYDQDENQSFISYTQVPFNKLDQKRLFDTFCSLTEKGVLVMLSNSDTPYIRELYSNYYIHTAYAYRLINSKADGRSKVRELIITNYRGEENVDLGKNN